MAQRNNDAIIRQLACKVVSSRNAFVNNPYKLAQMLDSIESLGIFLRNERIEQRGKCQLTLNMF